jgi:hypothetical protein
VCVDGLGREAGYTPTPMNEVDLHNRIDDLAFYFVTSMFYCPNFILYVTHFIYLLLI